MRKIGRLCFALCGLLMLLASCSESNDSASEYDNWQARNDTYFSNIRTLAKDSIAQAKAQYGSNWASHCNWRTYLKFSLEDTTVHKSTDSIYVEVLKSGTGSGCPYSSDSVRINYRSRLIPSTSYSEGYVFAHSGQSSSYDKIFDATTAAPSMFKVSSVVRGLSTALQKMHIGDLWRIYIPYRLAYDSEEKTGIPAYSNLIFEVQLVAYYRNGVTPDPWQ